MSSSGDYYCVVAVDGDRATLLHLTGVLGGESLKLPMAELPESGRSLGAVLRGEVIIDGDETLAEFDDDLVGHARRAKPQFTKNGWSVGKRTIPFPAGVPDTADRQRAQRAEFWLIEAPIPGLALEGFFTDLTSFLDGEKAAKTATEAAKAAAAEKRQHGAWRANRSDYDPDAFVNPYNFVPLPAVAPKRSVPSGHSKRRPDRLHGRIDVTFTALAPLLVRDSGDEAPKLPRRGGNVVIPGSSVKGALRSVFEAVTGSCMRVVDQDYVPAYRDVLRAANRANWSLIEVVEVDREDRPTKVRKSSGKPVWFSLEVLQDVLGREGVKTGAQFTLTGTPRPVGAGDKGRDEVRSTSDVAKLGAAGRVMTLLVTDDRARPRNKGVCFVAGELKSEAAVTVEPDAWRRFESALDGGQDVKRGTKLDALSDGTIVLDIQKKSRGRAYRQVQGVVEKGKGKPGLRPGHVLWARFDGSDTITELAFAHTWRHGATGESLGERIPEGFRPCTGADGLCPACSVFGSANTKGAGEDRDQAYRGHLRFTDWAVDGGQQQVKLAPLGLPRPGSGQMYLTHPQSDLPVQARDGSQPLREWGSALDSPKQRQIRGRKFYWRVGDAPGRPPRYKVHPSQVGKDNKGSQVKDVELIDAGALISGSITFENLTVEQLGAIVASLAPVHLQAFQHAAREDEVGTFCFTVGGGKPLGLGAMESTGLTVTLDGAAERYTGTHAEQVKPEAAAAAFAEGASEALRSTWADLLELLRWNAVNPAMVSYPRETPWPKKADSDDRDLYKAGFDWWKRSAGMPKDGLGSTDAQVIAEHSYVTLPSATADKVTLPIDIQRPDSEAPKGGKR